MTTPMRRKDRQVEDRAEIADILNRSLVCRLGLQDEEGMYIVPLNYGYRWKETEAAPTLYFHSAPDGRKIRAIRSMKRILLTRQIFELVFFQPLLKPYANFHLEQFF